MTFIEVELQGYKTHQEMLEGEVEKRQSHFDSLSDDEAKAAYGPALESTKKRLEEMTALVDKQQKAVDAMNKKSGKKDAAANTEKAVA